MTILKITLCTALIIIVEITLRFLFENVGIPDWINGFFCGMAGLALYMLIYELEL